MQGQSRPRASDLGIRCNLQVREVLTGLRLWTSRSAVWVRFVCCGAVCMGEEEGDFERGGGKPLLVFYYGRARAAD